LIICVYNVDPRSASPVGRSAALAGGADGAHADATSITSAKRVTIKANRLLSVEFIFAS
jgi:hypothetical protein